MRPAKFSSPFRYLSQSSSQHHITSHHILTSYYITSSASTLINLLPSSPSFKKPLSVYKKIMRLHLVTDAVLLASILVVASAFVPTVKFGVGNHHHAIDNTNVLQRNQQQECMLSIAETAMNARRRFGLTTRRFLAAGDDDELDDDDDDDYDEEKGPLSNGVDSVSWLPSVVDAKGDNMPITSAKEVRTEK